ncbi:hypothetical protein AHAS_Ahas13G0377400 [Arachis hypogaea]
MQVYYVSALLNPDRSWNKNLIESIFSVDICNKIFSIKPTDEEDEVNWCWTKSGIYEVGLGYKIAYGFFHSPTSLRSQNIHNRVWNSIWELKLPHKIKIFLWKSLHEKLSVLQQVHSRFASTPATCPRCMLKAESISHALFQCPLSSIIWSLSLITPDLWMREEETFFNWWQRVLSWAAAQFDGRQKTLLIAALCWSTWKARNRCVFEKVISPHQR